MKFIYYALHWFHGLWIILLIGGAWFGQAYPWYSSIHTIIIVTTVISQLVFISCPIVLLQGTIARRYLGQTEEPLLSFTAYLLKKFFNVDISPAGVTITTSIILTVVTICTLI